MDEIVNQHLENLASTDDRVRMEALQALLLMTETKVDWIDDAWDLLVGKLEHENSYQRSIGIMLLCNLAKSDDRNRMSLVLPRLLAHTRDEKFITSRQCLQNIWKVAVTDPENCAAVLNHLEMRFKECDEEKHANLLRLDIIQSFCKIFNHLKDRSVLNLAEDLITLEKDVKLRGKYQAVFN
jgi:hypothetical protein